MLGEELTGSFPLPLGEFHCYNFIPLKVLLMHSVDRCVLDTAIAVHKLNESQKRTQDTQTTVSETVHMKNNSLTPNTQMAKGKNSDTSEDR